VKGDKKDGIGEEEMGKMKMAWNHAQIEVIKQNGNIMRF
jgi:hypothetical protein